MRPLTRRDFLNSSASAAALAAAAAATGSTRAEDQAKVVTAAKKGTASDRLRVAIVGVNSRGMSHVHGFAGKHNCEVTVICDCDEAVIGKAMTESEKAQGKAPRFEQDIRKVVEDKDIDVITIATPNHWHALAAIWAMQNGKDVYCEKPVSHNVREGRMIVEVAKATKKICQTGTQSRTNKGMRAAIDYVQSGKIGKVTLSRGLCYKSRPSIGKVTAPTEPPKTIKYDLWCGPAPVKPVMRKKLHYDWHWTWDYGNGDLGNQGIHEMDKARWGLGKMEMPKSVFSLGGRFGYVDDGETANTQVCVFDYGDCELIFEVRGLKTAKLKGAGVGNIFSGSEGYVVCPSYDSGIAYDNDGKELQRFSGGGDHFGNFVEAVRARKPELLNAHILEGHLSSALCHLGNVSYRLGTLANFGDAASLPCAGDKQAMETVGRMQDHLKENQVDLAKTQVRVGQRLTLDPAKETFIGAGSPEANPMLTREYRKGFEVPATA